MKVLHQYIQIFAMILVANFSLANTNTINNNSIFDLINYQEMLEVDLKLNMEEVFGNRRSEDKHKAVLSFNDKNGIGQTWDIKVALRGKFRRTRCNNLAPLKLHFKKSDLYDAGLAKFNDLKLVNQCMEDSKDLKQLLVREYLAYKLYNQITEESFRVQFLKINYIDSQTGKSKKQYGFVIEDTAQLRARIDAAKVEKQFNTAQEKFNQEQVKLMSVFQYMIGNPDWSLNRSHNVKIVLQEDKLIAIPYDFDFSGFVEAPYVLLNDELGINSTKERIFLGFENHVEDLAKELDIFSNKKSLLIQTIKDCDALKGRNRREMIKFINSFYDETDTFKLPLQKNKVPTLGD
ncbi:MAG: hypothetical protein AB8H03_18375 [Saprospiraceae bacterium]